MDLQIETVEIKSNQKVLQYFSWVCFPCKDGRQTEWLEKEHVATSTCPECGKTYNADKPHN